MKLAYWGTVLAPLGTMMILLRNAEPRSFGTLTLTEWLAITATLVCSLPNDSLGRVLNIALLVLASLRFGRDKRFRYTQIVMLMAVLAVGGVMYEAIWPIAQKDLMALKSRQILLSASQQSGQAGQQKQGMSSQQGVQAGQQTQGVSNQQASGAGRRTKVLSSLAAEGVGRLKAKTNLSSLFWPLDSLDNTVVLTANIGRTIGFQHGITLLSQLSRFARLMGLNGVGRRWPSASELFTMTFYPDAWQKRVAFAVPSFAEFYLNFGWLGVFAGAALLGTVAAGMRQYLHQYPDNSSIILLYSIVAVELAASMRGELFGTTLTHLAASLLPAVLAAYAVSSGKRSV